MRDRYLVFSMGLIIFAILVTLGVSILLSAHSIYGGNYAYGVSACGAFCICAGIAFGSILAIKALKGRR